MSGLKSPLTHSARAPNGQKNIVTSPIGRYRRELARNSQERKECTEGQALSTEERARRQSNGANDTQKIRRWPVVLSRRYLKLRARLSQVSGIAGLSSCEDEGDEAVMF